MRISDWSSDVCSSDLQDLGDLVQECFRRLAMAKRQRLVLIEKPGAYLVSIARNLLTDRARADNARQSSQHHSFEDEEIAGPDPHAALEARDTMRRVGEANEKLKNQKTGRAPLYTPRTN